MLAAPPPSQFARLAHTSRSSIRAPVRRTCQSGNKQQATSSLRSDKLARNLRAGETRYIDRHGWSGHIGTGHSASGDKGRFLDSGSQTSI